MLKSLVGRIISVEICLTKTNVAEDNNLFYAEDIYEPRNQTPTPSETPIFSEGSSINMPLDVSENFNYCNYISFCEKVFRIFCNLTTIFAYVGIGR